MIEYKKRMKERVKEHKQRRLHLREVRKKLKEDYRQREPLLNTIVGKEPQYKEDEPTE